MYVRKGKINATIVKESLKVLGLITYYIIHNLLLLLYSERGIFKCTGPTARRYPAQKSCGDSDACFYRVQSFVFASFIVLMTDELMSRVSKLDFSN